MSAVELHARPSVDHSRKLTGAVELLDAAARAYSGRIVLATSFGAEDMVLTHLIARHHLPIALATLDTGWLHDETLALLARVEAVYGLRVERVTPKQQAVLRFVRQHGDRAMYESIELRQACCALRKVEPLSRLLEGQSAWVTGLRREQSHTRAEVPFSEADAQGRIKFNPLADWTWGDVWHHIGVHEVPYNALHDRFYPSIGCAPCTRAVAVGEDLRAGRWWWENEAAKECGLHVSHADGAPA